MSAQPPVADAPALTSPSDQSLSLAFMRGHPAQAAQVLDALPAAQAAALFERAPARLAAAVLAAMLPRRAAACLAALGDERALDLLAALGTQTTVTLLRHLPEPRRRGLIAGLPTATALASTLLLGYADDTLGAWADPDVVSLPGETRAADALERMRVTPPAHPLVFVAAADQRLVGSVGLAALLHAPAGASLATLAQPPVARLAAVAPLAAAAVHPGWEFSSLLPVVEAGERLVGVISREALTRALRRAAPDLSAPAPVGLPLMLAQGYWQALSGLLQAALVLLPRVPPVRGPGDEP